MNLLLTGIIVIVVLIILAMAFLNVAILGGSQEKGLYNNLLRKTAGDKMLAERLIEAERQRNPHLSRIELIKRAIERWEAHNK